MKKAILGLAVLGLAGTAHAKISQFTNQQVLNHVLASKQLKAHQANGKQLDELELTSAQIDRTGGPGIGTAYEVSLLFVALPYPGFVSVPTSCSVKARVTNEKAPAPRGITASRLSAPEIPDFSCAE